MRKKNATKFANYARYTASQESMQHQQTRKHYIGKQPITDCKSCCVEKNPSGEKKMKKNRTSNIKCK